MEWSCLEVVENKEEGKKLAKNIVYEQFGKAMEYLKDEKNREKVIKAGIGIAQVVIAIAQKKKSN